MQVETLDDLNPPQGWDYLTKRYQVAKPRPRDFGWVTSLGLCTWDRQPKPAYHVVRDWIADWRSTL